MTETSPLCALALPPRGTPPEEEIDWRAKTGRVVPGVEVRVVAEDGSVLPNDGESVGEFEVRGPWITGSYYGRPVPERFHDGWLRTGDIGTARPPGIHADQRPDQGRDQVGRRVDLVGRAGERGHGPPRRWSRPRSSPCPTSGGASARWSPWWWKRGPMSSPDELVEFLTGRVSRWWLPERWAFVDEVPKTSVGKFDKKVLRSRYAEGDLEAIEVDVPRPG